MAITLKRLSIICDKHDMKIIAGKAGLNRRVSWVHIVEDKEILKFLKGSEIIITTGSGIAGNKDFDFIHAAQLLIDANAAGWVINIGYFIKEIPEELIEFCDKNNFPLFTVPWKEKIIDVTYDITRFILFNDEMVTSLAKVFSDVINKNGNMRKNIDLLVEEGFLENDIYQLLYIKPLIDSDLQIDIEPKINSYLKYFMFVENGNVIVIMSSNDKCNENDLIKQVESYYASQNIEFRAGLSKKKYGLSNLEKVYKQAKIACECLNDNSKKIVEYNDSELYQVICNIEDDNVLLKYSDSLIKNIKDYDLKNKTDYLKIIELYILKNGSVNDVASELKVHRNTINYRLKFIKEHFNIDMSIESLSKIYLAIVINKVKG